MKDWPSCAPVKDRVPGLLIHGDGSRLITDHTLAQCRSRLLGGRDRVCLAVPVATLSQLPNPVSSTP